MIVFKNKFLFKLIAIVCLIITITMSCTTTNKVWAADDEETEEEVWGGALLSPIVKLIVGLGDAVVDILHQNIRKQDVSLIRIDSSDFLTRFRGFILALIAAIVVIAVAVTGVGALVEAGVLAAAAAGKAILVSIFVAGATAGVVSEKIEAEWIPNDVYLPIYRVSAQEIFANEIPLFDINFFKPMETKIIKETMTSNGFTERLIVQYEMYDKYGDTYKYSVENPYTLSNQDWISGFKKEQYAGVENLILTEEKNVEKEEAGYYGYAFGDYTRLDKVMHNYENSKDYSIDQLLTWFDSQMGGAEAKQQLTNIIKIVNTELEKKDYNKIDQNAKVYQMAQQDDNGQTTRLIFFGTRLEENKNENIKQLGWGRIYIFLKYEYGEQKSVIEKELDSTAAQLSNIVSQWYFTLRNLALLVLMLLLIYSGIRIVIGSTAGEKAKHKERIMDWFIAMCLIFVMHYIMVFAVELNEKIIELIKTSVEQGTVIKNVGLGDSESIKYKNAKKLPELQGHISEEGADIDGDGVIEYYDVNENGKTDYYVVWETDLMGGIRINAQESKEGTATWVGSSICFLILVAFTLFFAWTYLRRLVYMTFLTMVAPLVAMTYPLDKITDGKAQAFNTWLKEYIFNLLIQPMHLILYTVLISSAYQLASTNVIYAIVAMGFMIPAEKLIRRFFGFEKAETPGVLGGAAGAALAMTGMQGVMKWGQNHGGNVKEERESNESSKIKYSSSDGVNNIKNYAEDYMDEEYEPKELKDEGQPRTVAVPVLTSNNTAGSEVAANSINYSEGTAGGTSTDYESSNPVFKNTQDQLRINAELQAKKKEKEKQKANQNKKGRIGRTIKGVSSAYARELGNKTLRRIEHGHPVRTLARGMLGLAGGATFGMLGLALGVASGDPNKAFQYISTGALGGYQAGKGIAGSAVNTLSVNSQKMGDELELSWYDADEYKKAMFEKQKKEVLEDEGYITHIRKMTGKSRKEAKDLLNDTGDWCLNSGIRDVDDMIAIDRIRQEIVGEQEELIDAQNRAISEQQRTEIDNYAIKRAISMKKSSDRLPTDIHKIGAKRLEEHRKQFQKEIESQLQKEIKNELVSRIRSKSQREVSEELKRQLQEKGEHISEDRFKQLLEERIEQLADIQISQRAKDASEEMMAGIVRFSEAKSSIGEA